MGAGDLGHVASMSRRGYVRSVVTKQLPTYTCALCSGPAKRSDMCYGCGARVCYRHRTYVGPHLLTDHERKTKR